MELRKLKDMMKEWEEEMVEEDERTDVIQNIGEWVKTLRSIKDTLDNPLATDYQMETVRQAVDGLIITTVAQYKSMTGT
jgi:hypothetical protein